jgi:intracellular septation protein A
MTTAAKNNTLVELLITLIIPSLILMKLSGPENLGAVFALLLALAFPLGWGVRDYLLQRKLNLFAALGLVSILLTGGIGLLQLDTRWLAVKEAAIPGLIGLAVAISAYTRQPLVRLLLFSPAIMNVERIQENLVQRNTHDQFEGRLKSATLMISGSFFFSAVMNYLLATWIVTSPSGTTAFNEELGQLTLLSYPMIALPSMLIMLGVLYYLVRSIRQLAGLQLTEALKQS